jgi:fucose permease
VVYLVDVRHGKLSEVGYTPAGLYGGIFLGRLLLAEPTHRFGERRMILLYGVIMLGLQLVFWLVPTIIASATALSLLGFLFGPLFPIVSYISRSAMESIKQGSTYWNRVFPSAQSYFLIQ